MQGNMESTYFILKRHDSNFNNVNCLSFQNLMQSIFALSLIFFKMDRNVFTLFAFIFTLLVLIADL